LVGVLHGEERRGALLARYAALCALGVAIHVSLYLGSVDLLGGGAGAFAALALVTVPVVFQIPVFGLLWGLNVAANRLRWRHRDALVLGLAALVFAAVHVFLYLDRLVYRLYDFHMNGFVWNLMTTRGGIESMGAGSATHWTLAAMILACVGVQGLLLAAVLKVPRLRTAGAGWVTRRRLAAGAAVLALLVLSEKAAYGVSRYSQHLPVLRVADALPCYIPVSFRRVLKSLGLREPPRDLEIKVETTRAPQYPLDPIRRDPARPRLNLVWLVAESWRWDMLDPEVTPEAWAFAGKSVRFTRHYSGGNGTRMGMFAMFYGLYGSYWMPFLREGRGPVLLDVLVDEGYQFDLHTSAKFTYPEFDRTIFARVPQAALHEAAPGQPGWQADRERVSALLESIDGRDPSRPFMEFMFFESPHAPYRFPEETAVRKPYLAELNYLQLSPKEDAPLIKNRYVNACRHLDTQIARILRRLEERGLLDRTIVVLTGDHGEEFMEKGRWGHTSAFTEEQTRVPLVLWAPGRPPAVVDRLTSHLDLPATVLTLLGVTTPPDRYSLGQDLLGPGERSFTVFSGWNNLGYADSEYKADLPLGTFDVVHRSVTTAEDRPVSDRRAFFESRRSRLLTILKDARRFLR
jgi:hypothetical protein